MNLEMRESISIRYKAYPQSERFFPQNLNIMSLTNQLIHGTNQLNVHVSF